MKYDRHQQMKQLFLKQKNVTNKELCETFSISIETVRRDLSLLEKEGVIKRVYGGAILASDNIMPESMPPWATRSSRFQPIKRAIAREVIKWIPDNSTIALDSGTTVLEVAKLLHEREKLTILTNCMHTALELSAGSNHMVYFIGGAIKRDEMITTGFLAADFLEYFSHIDIAVLSGDGFSVSEGMSDYSVEMGTIKSSIIEKSDKVYACIDSSKFSVNAFYKVCSIDKLDMIITDNRIPEDALSALRSANVQVVQVPV